MAPTSDDKMGGPSWADVAASIILLALYALGVIFFVAFSERGTVRGRSGQQILSQTAANQAGVRPIDVPGWHPHNKAGVLLDTMRHPPHNDALPLDRQRTAPQFRKDLLMNALHRDWRARWVRPAAKPPTHKR